MLYYKYWFLFMVNIVILLSLNVESRGGRGGRGGSFGGSIFGNWRKYKKPSNNNQNGKSRRIVSSSPMHTPLTKSLAENHKNNNNYPVSLFKRKLSEHNKYRHRHNLPPGGSYYNDLDRIPQNAVFVSQMPPRSSEATNFLATYLGFTLGWHSVLHQQQHNNNNNNPLMTYNVMPSGLNFTNHTENITYTKKLIINNRHNESLPLVATADVANIANPIDEGYNQTTTATIATAITAVKQQMNNLTAPWGVICVNMKFNGHQGDENIDINRENIIEKLICYPAPPPTTSADDVPFITNSYRTNNVYKQLRTTITPIQVAGDIIEAK